MVLWIIISTSFAFLISCGGKDSPVPRRYAYPRIQLYPEKYCVIPGENSVNIEKNASSIVLTDSVAGLNSRWITISYPMYSANLYLTVNECDDSIQFENVYSNRVQRIALNTGGKDYEQLEIENAAGFLSEILTIRTGSANPVMFLSTKNKKYVVSGIFYMSDAGNISKPDSVAPIIDAVRKDVVHLVKNLNLK